MTKLPNKEFQQLVPLLREKGFYEHQKQRKIVWPEYNLSQIEDAKDTLIFIREEVDKAEYLNIAGKTGKPLTDPKELAKAILICEALGFTERQAEGWLDIIGPFAGIYQHLDDRTIGDAYDRIEVLYILKQVFENSKTSDGNLAGDGSGIEVSRKQNYESDKEYGNYLINIVDSREIVQAFDISGKQECQIMLNLIEKVNGDSLTLDAGFNSRELTAKISELGIIPFIFPKKNNILNGRSAWKLMYLELYYDAMQWLINYHQRSHAESFYSSFKRKNKLLMKRRFLCRLTEITARIILHNRRKLSYFNKLANAS